MTTEVNVSKREDSVVQLNRADPSENVLTDLTVSVQRGKVDEDNLHFFMKKQSRITCLLLNVFCVLILNKVVANECLTQ